MTNAKHLITLMVLGVTGAGVAVVLSMLAPGDEPADIPTDAPVVAQLAAPDAAVGEASETDSPRADTSADPRPADNLPDTAEVGHAAVPDDLPPANDAPPADDADDATPADAAPPPRTEEVPAPTDEASAPTAAEDAPKPPDSASVDPQQIQTAIREQFAPAARRCYEDLIKEFPDDALNGRVVLAFDVTTYKGEGRVELAEPGEDTTLMDERLHDCMLEGLAEVVFPAPPGDGKLRVNYPIQLTSQPPD